MTANPVLAELIRNNWVENRHRGAFCVLDASGEVIVSTGDIERAIFPRSAIKSLQALALFKSGAVEKFGLDDKSIALASASHLGEPAHIEGVRVTLQKIGCSEADFECGIHPPSCRTARNNLRNSGIEPSAIHNNCSGKHSGMLAVARALDVPVKGYSELDHPVQKLVRACIEELIGQDLTPDRCGTDGCSIPTWAAPMKAFAYGFARAASGEGLDPETARGARAIINAAMANPFLVGGTDAFDSDAMDVFAGKLMSKGGAEGVYCGSLPELGLGYALKCDDGNMLAAETMVSNLLIGVAQPDEKQREFLQERQQKTLKNWRKIKVATMRALTP